MEQKLYSTIQRQMHYPLDMRSEFDVRKKTENEWTELYSFSLVVIVLQSRIDITETELIVCTVDDDFNYNIKR